MLQSEAGPWAWGRKTGKTWSWAPFGYAKSHRCPQQPARGSSSSPFYR